MKSMVKGMSARADRWLERAERSEARVQELEKGDVKRVADICRLTEERDQLNAVAEEQRRAMAGMVEGWERLSEGHHSGRVIQRWLVDDMKPAIDAVRLVINKEVDR